MLYLIYKTGVVFLCITQNFLGDDKFGRGRKFLSSLVISVFLLVNVSNLSTCSRGFSSFPQPCSTGTQSYNAGKIFTRQACVDGACIKDVSAYPGNVSTQDTGTESTYIKRACARGTCFDVACKEADICSDSACTEAGTSIGGACIEGASTNSASIAGTCAGRACIEGIYTSSTSAKDACTRFASDKSAYIATVCAVKRSKMHLQSFWILEVVGAR